MRVFVHEPREDWIVDRIACEFKSGARDLVTSDTASADVIWMPAGWCVDQARSMRLKQHAKFLITVHHLCDEKPAQAQHIIDNDDIASCYHVPCEKTRAALSRLTTKPIIVIPYWVNEEIWHPITQEERRAIRVSLGLAPSTVVIGSFQRDTEGADGTSPKLEKGPDIFCDYVERRSRVEDVTVLLTGYRRKYVTDRLRSAGVKLSLFERAPVSAMRWLYGALDMYVVSSRCEGGPQALLECAACRIPVISRDVGMARDVLAPVSVNDNLMLAVSDVDTAAGRAAQLSMSAMIPQYRAALKALCER